MTRKTHQRGFTLVEILIVVVILGILASIIIPQVSGATANTKKAALSDQLHNIRVQIQLFTLQHGDNRPTLTGSDWDDLITQTTFNGDPRGPYLPAIPKNTLNNFSDIEVVAADPAWGDAVSGTNIGFVYNPITGVIWGTSASGTHVYNEANPEDPLNN